jgi:hypothetical protein
VTTRIKLEVGEVDLTGPVVEGRYQPVMREFFDKAKTLVANHGREQVQQRARSRPKHPTGSFAGAVMVRDFKKGRTVIAEHPQVLYGPWLEGTSTRNTSTRFKGYRIFKLTRGRLRKQVSHLVQGLLNQALDKLRGGGGG